MRLKRMGLKRMGLKRMGLLLVLLILFFSSTSPGEALPKPPQEGLLEESVAPGCQWFWVRDVETTFAGWFSTDEEGNPDPSSPVACQKEPGAEFVFLDIPAEAFEDPENPPQIVEVAYLPYRAGNWGSHHGIELVPTGHWEWTCG